MIEWLQHTGLIFMAAMVLTFVLCFTLTPIARHLGWVDTPDHRRHVPVPIRFRLQALALPVHDLVRRAAFAGADFWCEHRW